MSKPHGFTAEIQAGDRGGAYVVVPPNVKAALGSAARPKVTATFDGEPYRGSVVNTGNGVPVLGLVKAIRQKIAREIGDQVRVTIALDTVPRTVEVPPDLASRLEKHAEERAAFDRLSYTYQREFVEWITGARKPETRTRRVEKTLSMLARGETR